MYAGNYSPTLQLLPKSLEDLQNWNQKAIYAASAEELKFEKEEKEEIYSEEEEL